MRSNRIAAVAFFLFWAGVVVRVEGSVRVELSGKQFMNGTHQYDWKTTEIEMNHLCETSQL